MPSIILKTTSRFLLILMLLFSIWVLLRGHNAPGGGFIAGLVASSAFSLYLIAHGPAKLRKILLIDLHYWLSIGLLLTLLSGIIGLFNHQSFLTGKWLPTFILKNIPINLGTPLLFDLGIFFTIVGSVMLIILSLEEIR